VSVVTIQADVKLDKLETAPELSLKTRRVGLEWVRVQAALDLKNHDILNEYSYVAQTTHQPVNNSTMTNQEALLCLKN
jgi:hypothetical protein